MYSEQFTTAWNLYPRKLGKPLAFKKFNLAIKRDGYESVINGICKYAEYTKSTEKQFIKHFSTFLHQQCYLDDFQSDTGGINPPNGTNDTGPRGIRSGMVAATKAIQKDRSNQGMEQRTNFDGNQLPY